jgi:hypothetical protein
MVRSLTKATEFDNFDFDLETSVWAYTVEKILHLPSIGLNK